MFLLILNLLFDTTTTTPYFMFIKIKRFNPSISSLPISSSSSPNSISIPRTQSPIPTKKKNQVHLNKKQFIFRSFNHLIFYRVLRLYIDRQINLNLNTNNLVTLILTLTWTAVMNTTQNKKKLLRRLHHKVHNLQFQNQLLYRNLILNLLNQKNYNI